MPRATPPEPVPPASSAAPGPAGTAPAPIISLLARAGRLTDLLPSLHQHAIDVTGGARSLLFEHNPRTGLLQATSGLGVDTLRTDPWTPDPGEAEVVAQAFARHAARLVTDADRSLPGLAARLETRALLLVPLSRGEEPLGLLVVGFEGARPPGATADTTELAGAFATALDVRRLRRNETLQRDLRQLLDEFSRSLSSTLNLSAGLDAFCHGASRLLGADRASVWIHDRRARLLTLVASSDADPAARRAPVDAGDLRSPAAVAMRRVRAEIRAGGGDDTAPLVTIPLRGCRRALGTVVLDGVRIEPGGELDLLDRADELGRQLSNAIENLQLLDEVLQSRRELENVFDSIADLVVVADRRGHVVHVNQAFATRLDRTRDELLNRPLVDFVGPELAGWLSGRAAPPGAPDQDHGPTSREIVDPALHGPFLVTVTDLVNHERARVGRVVVARDLTPQAGLEAEREELRQRLTQSQKLAALGQFVAGIAHELNNPLQGVLGHLELLRVTGAFPKQLRREVQTIYREADRAAKIVRNLLVFAGSRRLARRSVSLNAVLQKVAALRAPACRAADIEIVRHYDEKLPRVQSDPLLLHQVFLNMVMNAEHAVQSTGAGGRIEISTAVDRARRMIVARVRDTGCGLAPDVLSRLFEPFYTTKDVGKGTGLGLAIAYRIVQDHGGQILAANHPEGGAVFTVELPVAVPARH